MPDHVRTFRQDPDETLDYTFDWSSWLATGETISTSTWTVPSGLTAGANSKTDTTATQWISGGTAQTTYAVSNKIVTSAGRTAQRSIQITVEER